VSIDGLPEHQDRQRPKAGGGGSFDDVARTLRIFDEEKIFYAVRATITRENVGTMAEMVAFFDDGFAVGDLQFDPLIFSGRCNETGCSGPDDDTYIAEYIRAYTEARRRNRMVGFSCLSFTSLKTFYCCAVADGFTITHEGLVTSCFESCGLDRPFADTFVYGNYDERSGAFDLRLDKLEKLQRRNVHNLPFCADCFCKYMCAGDCPIHSLGMGYNMERGTRCKITRAIGTHRLAAMVRESPPVVQVIQEEELHA
jgi:uncharacterized protein